MCNAEKLKPEADGAELVPGGRVIRRTLNVVTAAPRSLFLRGAGVHLITRLPLWSPRAAIAASLLAGFVSLGFSRIF
jgi:hypothetical protein